MSEMKLSDCCLSISDGDHMPPPKAKEGVPFITISDISSVNQIDFSNCMYVPISYWNTVDDKRKPHTGDVLYTVTGSYGIPVYIENDKEFVFQRHIAILRPNPSVIDGKYLFYLLKNPSTKEMVDKLVTGAIQKTLGLEMIREMTFDIPPIEQQRKIVNVISDIDKKILNNNAICADLDAILKLLYDYWFVQYDFPSNSEKPYKSSGGKMVWCEKIGREIPEGWKVRPVLEIFDWIGTSQPPKSSFIYEPREGYIRFIQNRDYEDDNHLTYIPLADNTRICDETDIMMDKYGDAGKTRYGIAGAYNVALSKINVHEENMKEYVRSYLSSEYIYEYLHSACIASTRASLNEANFEFLTIVIPDERTLERFNVIATNIIKKSLAIRSENKDLNEQRDFLLPMLMNGQVKVGN